MTPQQITPILAHLIAGTALLIAVFNDNPWVGLAPCLLFVFVFYPRWRKKIEAMIGRLIELAGNWRRNDSCDRE